MTWLLLTSSLLAQDQRPPNAPEFGGSSPIGLVVILLLFIAVFFLIRSMNTHLRKVPPSFDTQDSFDEPESLAEPGPSAEPGPTDPADRSVGSEPAVERRDGPQD